MLSTEEMRLKSRVQAAYIDSTSSSPVVLLANSGSNVRRSTTDKVNKPCFNFNKGFSRFVVSCKFLHNGVHGFVSNNSHRGQKSTVASKTNLSSNEIVSLQSLLAKL